MKCFHKDCNRIAEQGHPYCCASCAVSDLSGEAPIHDERCWKQDGVTHSSIATNATIARRTNDDRSRGYEMNDYPLISSECIDCQQNFKQIERLEDENFRLKKSIRDLESELTAQSVILKNAEQDRDTFAKEADNLESRCTKLQIAVRDAMDSFEKAMTS